MRSAESTGEVGRSIVGITLPPITVPGTIKCHACARNARPVPGQRSSFPDELVVGDVVLEEGAQLQVVGRPTATAGGKTTRAWVQREREPVQPEAVWEPWCRVRLARKSAA